MRMTKTFTGPAQDLVLGHEKNQLHRAAPRARTKGRNTEFCLLSTPSTLCIPCDLMTLKRIKNFQDNSSGDKNFEHNFTKKKKVPKKLRRLREHKSEADWGLWVTPMITHGASPRRAWAPEMTSYPESLRVPLVQPEGYILWMRGKESDEKATENGKNWV